MIARSGYGRFVHIGRSLRTEVDGAPLDARRQAEVYGAPLVHAVGIDDGMASVQDGDVVALVLELLHARQLVADGVGAVDG